MNNWKKTARSAYSKARKPKASKAKRKHDEA
jgi:hypothetical protein